MKLTWTPSSDDYWIFTATDPSLTAFNWTSLPNAHGYTSAATPFYMCGLFDGTPYYFAANGRTNGGPGGPSSPTISGTPYNSSAAWTANTSPLAQIVNNAIVNPNIFGLGYASLTTCSNNTASATGIFAAVGAGGAIFTSPDGLSWTPSAPPTSFSADLYAVTGYAASQNNVLSPALRWVAVGAGGASIYSLDGLGWNVGNPANSSSVANPANQALRSITQVAGTFVAVGDTGTIISSTDGITWTLHNSPSVTTNNLNGVTHGSIYVAVGNAGTILTSSDGNTWAVKIPTDPITHLPSPITSSLRQVTSFVSSYGSIYVAVGDAGTIVTSIDGGTTWIVQTAPTIGSSNLVGITTESRSVDTTTAVTDPSLLFISTAQFVAIDSSGNAYTSQNGYTWSAAAIPTGTSSLNALVSSGFGYVAAGNAGATAHAF